MSVYDFEISQIRGYPYSYFLNSREVEATFCPQLDGVHHLVLGRGVH